MILEYVDDTGRRITWDIVPAARPSWAPTETRARVWSCTIAVDQCSGVGTHEHAQLAYQQALEHLGSARDHAQTRKR